MIENFINNLKLNKFYLDWFSIYLLMKIKLTTKDTSKLLWHDSPCTLRNVIQNPSMDHAHRFHYGSIYFKDEVNKPKKVFT